jgi:hypothetical protein
VEKSLSASHTKILTPPKNGQRKRLEPLLMLEFLAFVGVLRNA